MTGPPDLNVELVSPDSGIADRRRKYAVWEYWIVDQDEELVEVYLLEAGSYLRAPVYAREEELKSTAVPELTVDLAEVFGVETGT